MTHYGFTGSSLVTTIDQRTSFTGFVISHHDDIESLHHGDCIRADQLAHSIVRANAPSAIIHGWLPIKPDMRAWCMFDVEHEPQSYFARNRDIVEHSDELLAMPMSMEELPKGGTWYTINYARKLNKPITIFWPDGSVTHENPAERKVA